MISATEGHYTPSGIHTIVTKPYAFKNNYISNIHGDENEALEAYVKPLIPVGTLATILVDIGTCSDAQNVAANANTVPIIAHGANGELTRALEHEWGHSANMGHAGTENCADPITVVNCTANETADPESVMSYTDSMKYTLPELSAMGLLRPQEVLHNLVDGDYTLYENLQTAAPGDVRMLTLDSPGGELYFTWQPDEQAAHDVLRVPPDTIKDTMTPGYADRQDYINGVYTAFTSYWVTSRMQIIACKCVVMKPRTVK